MYEATNPNTSYKRQFIGSIVQQGELIRRYKVHIKLTTIQLKNSKGDLTRRMEATSLAFHAAQDAEDKQYQLDKLNLMKKRLQEIENQIFFFETIPIHPLHVGDVITTINTVLCDETIKTGYTFKMPYIGYLSIRRRTRKRPLPNWDESNRRRAEIVARGGTPYSKTDAPDGEKWLIFYEGDKENIVNWKSFPTSLITNIHFYSFFPSIMNACSYASKMHRYVKENPNVIHNYRTWGEK